MAAMPTEKSVTFNDLTWSYRTAGKGAPLIWLHGLWGEPGWEPHHERLAEEYTVYAPVLPGYFGSDFPPWMAAMDDVALLLVAFLDALSLGSVFVAGHSIGGWAAAEVAIFRPQRVRGLVLIDPLGLCLDWTRIPNIFYCDPAALPGIFFSDAQAKTVSHYLPPPTRWDEKYIINRAASARLTFEPYLHSKRLAVRLPFAEVPAAIVWGAEDRLLSPDHAAQWKALMPSAQTVIIGGAGHFPHVERPDTCLPAILRFLQAAAGKEDPR